MFAWFVGLWVGVAALLLVVNGAKTLTRSNRKIVSYLRTRSREHARETALTS
jgi:heme exporter protein D